ncbi:MAG: hypothetical protein VKP62_12130 [Candidatus Sericytochromatia bacterium]|nr:hypothetical protein [Candidatus Sericytochromatia bacterium]
MLEINLTLPIMMVMFLLFSVGMNMVFFKPVSRALDARKTYLDAQRAAAQMSLDTALLLQTDYEARFKQAQAESHAAIQAALKSAEQNRQQLIEAANAEIAEEMGRAREVIRQERDRAVASLSSEVGAFSDLIQRRILSDAGGRSLAATPTSNVGGV